MKIYLRAAWLAFVGASTPPIAALIISAFV
jgi:hypothetical protein